MKALRAIFRQEVARRVQALVSIRKQLLGAVQEANALIEIKKRLSTCQSQCRHLALVEIIGVFQLRLPGAALIDELAIIGKIVVEAEVAITMAPERRGKGLAPSPARAFYACFGEPANPDARAAISKNRTPRAKLIAQLCATIVVAAPLGELEPLILKGSHIPALDFIK